MKLSVLSEGLYDLNKKYIGKTSSNLKVYEIDGEYFRTYLDTDFAGGGHHLVYKNIIPRNEIWVEKVTNSRDQKAIILHELVEHMLMLYFGMTYNEAHRRANNMEHLFRNKFKLHQ